MIPETRSYISRSDELGNIHISDEVLAAIAAAAALETEGVGNLEGAAKDDSAQRRGKRDFAKSVRIQVDEANRIEAELPILLTYGHTIPETGKAVQEGVKTAIESMTGLKVSSIQVNVAGIVFPAGK